MSSDLINSEVYFRDEFVPFSDANLSIASSPVVCVESTIQWVSFIKVNRTGFVIN